MRFFEDLATGKIIPPKNTIVASIPIYNIGGALNRNSTTRVNQNGPVNTVSAAMPEIMASI